MGIDSDFCILHQHFFSYVLLYSATLRLISIILLACDAYIYIENSPTFFLPIQVMVSSPKSLIIVLIF